MGESTIPVLQTDFSLLTQKQRNADNFKKVEKIVTKELYKQLFRGQIDIFKKRRKEKEAAKVAKITAIN